MSPPSSRSKNKLSKKPEEKKWQTMLGLFTNPEDDGDVFVLSVSWFSAE
jgi:hypothetical protein